MGSNTFDFLSLRSWIGIMSHHEQGTTAETPAWSSDSTESPVRDLTGTTLGDFEVKRLLGRGGMGQVYLATQISLNRPVALKVLHPRYLSKPIYLSRFEAEATAVAKLNHPNIVHVYTLGYVDPVRFIAMEYVEGTNLREYINKKGALDLPLALSIMRQAGQAIGAAGEVGLVHRDIKPENLLLTRKGRAKVADFGLCRDLGADRLHVTQPGTTMGTPLYMSPEQAQGKPLDHRSDLYSLGVTFYHMLSGEPPFRADSAVALALKHVSEQPVSLRVRRPDIPLELERLVLKLMAKSPADRYQSAAEMLADLARIRASLQPTLGSIGDENSISLPRVDEATKAGSGSGVALAATTATRTLPLVTSRLYRPRTLLLTGMIFVLVGAALGWSARPSDLPGGNLVARRPPGLAIEPRWALIPRQDTRRGTVPVCPAPRLRPRSGGGLACRTRVPFAFPGADVAGVPSAFAAALPPGRSRSTVGVQGRARRLASRQDSRPGAGADYRLCAQAAEQGPRRSDRRHGADRRCGRACQGRGAR